MVRHGAEGISSLEPLAFGGPGDRDHQSANRLTQAKKPDVNHDPSQCVSGKRHRYSTATESLRKRATLDPQARMCCNSLDGLDHEISKFLSQTSDVRQSVQPGVNPGPRPSRSSM